MKFKLMFLCAALFLAGCETFESNNGLVSGSRNLIDRATPTDGARARRAGFKAGEPVYFVTEIDGRRSSTGTRTRKLTSFRNQEADLLEVQQTFELVSRDGARIAQDISKKVITARDTGTALYSSEVVTRNNSRRQTSITIVGSEAKVRVVDNGQEEDYSIKVPDGVLFGVNPQWILAKSPDLGSTFTVNVIDLSAKAVATENVSVRNFAEEDVLGVKLGVWEVEIRRPGFKPTRMAFTSTGDVVRMQADNLVSYVVTKGVADRDEAKMEVINSVPVSFPLPAWDNFDIIEGRPVPFDRWSKYLRDTEYQQIKGSDLLLNRFAPRVGPANFPLSTPPAMSAFLQRSEGITPDDGEIADLARDIIASEKNVLKGIALLAGWVYQNIAFERGQGSNKNALDTLRKRTGDQLAHADLFASLARSLGIPTRHCSGLLVQRDKAYFHAWIEAWIDGVWVPVDTTVNRVGLPAGYILMTRGTGLGAPSDPFAWLLREGGLSLNVVSATKIHTVPGSGKTEKFTLYPGQKKTYVAVAGDWLANIYWGFSIVKPDKPIEWGGKIQLNAVTINSPGNEATVKVEALNKVLPCTESQLDMVVSSLERSLKGFRKINQGRVLFGKRRDNALFLDFSVALDNGARRRCQMYIIPKRGRSYRVTAWAPAEKFETWLLPFKQILDTVSL